MRFPLVAVFLLGVIGILLWAGCSRESADPDKTACDETPAFTEQANPIIAAIYQFRHERGLWPRDLDELDPDYLTRDASRGWMYEPWYNGRWTLSCFGPEFDSAIRLVHVSDEQTAEWKLDFGDSDRSLDIRPILPAFKPVDDQIRKMNRRETILKRIVQHPKEVLHQKALVSDLYKEGHFQESRDACLSCLERWPDLWWPNLILALVDLKLGEFKRGDQRLSLWVKNHDEFCHWYIAAYFYYKASEKESSFDALRRAANSELTGIPVEWEDTFEHFGSLPAAWIATCATDLAYQEGKTELCLALCDRWQQYVDGRHGSRAFHLYRAACYLREGRFADASSEADRAAKSNYSDCHGEHVKKLKEAIRTCDRAFRYTSPEVAGKSDGDFWDIVIDYK